jgi:hypothetical protein
MGTIKKPPTIVTPPKAPPPAPKPGPNPHRP